MPAIDLIVPDIGLLRVQQLRQHGAVGHTRRRRHCRVNELRLVVHPDVRLHPEVPLVAFFRLVHLRVTLLHAVLRRLGRLNGGGVRDVPVVIRTPLLCKCKFTASSICRPGGPHPSRWRNLQTVVSSGTGSCPRSMPTNCHIRSVHSWRPGQSRASPHAAAEGDSERNGSDDTDCNG